MYYKKYYSSRIKTAHVFFGFSALSLFGIVLVIFSPIAVQVGFGLALFSCFFGFLGWLLRRDYTAKMAFWDRLQKYGKRETVVINKIGLNLLDINAWCRYLVAKIDKGYYDSTYVAYFQYQGEVLEVYLKASSVQLKVGSTLDVIFDPGDPSKFIY